MTPPEGYTKAQPGDVCHLKRSLYGLKQASRQWNVEFCARLRQFGFTQSANDHCLFVKGTPHRCLVLLVYVDDVLITGTDSQDIADLKRYLDDLFTIKDLGFAKYFLGMEIARNEDGTVLNQRKYILDILRDTGMLHCKAASMYRRLVGRLLYLNLTRPDVTYSVQQLSQFVNSPRTSHWDAVLHLLRYLKGSPSLGLHYSSSSTFTLEAYSDADWASCIDSRKSLTGYCVFLGSCLVSWKTKKQTTVSRSSAEAEYRALGSTVCELQWLSFLCADLFISVHAPIPLWCDNQAAIHITKNPVFHERTKHLDIDCHLVRDLYKAGFITLCHVSSRLQLADLFTKSLARGPFLSISSKLGFYDLHNPT
ncbi:hypothetical protein DH2020_030389 [Rehmannia glutinosa]|uniref:Reverse transcriptase Ty1/copia-type domain-containing protein n=1 Tax=Rehmannia glutinosa TaxID=99300 RepID=A0ABR0VL14_REHGL